MELWLNITAALFAFIAAACWLWASVVKIPPVNEPDESGFVPASYGTRDKDVGLTMKAQSKWNAMAAFFAGMAALMQGLTLFLFLL